ncbi:oxidoreductase [Mycobacterium paraffinicum]|uniref:Oxidoreductase n=1 Tax=Mycobacterium paraffinicum TaxID=53378 RepID=A0A1Q4I2N6_9MYCO|nr:SDR family oxidoreductase [Mycobacterium paraffinicum]OJZ76175.1 oxidoreductase [Mycobacterium paraffinicum]
MSDTGLAGAGVLVVGASSGIGRAVAIAAAARGARVAVAARRTNLLEALAVELGGTAHQLDVTSPASISRAVAEAAEALAGLDVLVCSCGVFPLARVEHVDAATWKEAFAVNTIGPALVLSAAFPYLSPDAVIAVASSDKVGRPPAATAAYSASKAALDEILRSWRLEHPDLRVIRLGIGPTADTELMRGADQDLVVELTELWRREGRLPETMAAVSDVAELVVATIATARSTETVVAESVQFRPRLATGTNPDPTRRESV